MPAITGQTLSYDVYQTYVGLRKQTPDPLPPALAAVSAIVTALDSLAPQTISETLALLTSLSNELKSQVHNPSVLAAGTDVFQRFLVTSLARTGQAASGDTQASKTETDDFQAIKAGIVRAGEQYIQKGLEDRARAMRRGARYVNHGYTVIVPAPSKMVTDLLVESAKEGRMFRVVLVTSSTTSGQEYKDLQDALKESETPIATIPAEGLADAMARMPREEVPGMPRTDNKQVVLSGAATVIGNGGIVAPRGTFQAACIAKALGKEFWVVPEGSHCARWTFRAEDDTPNPVVFDPEDATVHKAADLWEDGWMDVTGPQYITRIYTENGPQVPGALADEAIRLWF